MFLITKYLTMLMPEMHGKCTQNQFFIYTACDTDYFDEFGQALVVSILRNSTAGVHVHLYNPRPDQMAWCQSQPRLSTTWEWVSQDLFAPAAAAWSVEPTDPVLADQYRRTQTAMSKSNDRDIQQRMQRTYYACARFIRLQQMMLLGDQVLAIDSDAVVRADVPKLPTTVDFYLHHISGRKARYLAGGLYLTGTTESHGFLNSYADVLSQSIAQDHLYWGLDQDVLNNIVPQYQNGQLPTSYIDWEMQPHSFVWTAKGQRKDLAVFVNEKKKYTA
jgi:hypothetical protein